MKRNKKVHFYLVERNSLGEPEIDNLQITFCVKEKILGFQV
jgi:hypothetical protein